MEFFYKHVHNMNILFIFPKYVLILKWHDYKRKGIVGKSLTSYIVIEMEGVTIL